MTTIEYGSDINLEELRGELVARLAVMTIISTYLGGVVAMIPVLRKEPYPFTSLGLLVALLGLGISVRVLVSFSPGLARHLLVWGLTAALLMSMGLFSEPWLPFAGLMLTLVCAMLVSGSGFVTGVIVAAFAAWLVYSGVRAYPLVGLLSTLALSTVLAWLVVRTLYTALGWAWTMQQRADHLLELARDRQGELANVLKSLDMNNAILRRTQRELIAARKQAEEARVMKEQFAANVSHELRTPLNLILGFSEMMYLSPQVYMRDWPPTLRRDVYQIYRSSRHLLEMIDDVLDLSRFEIAGFTLHKEMISLESLLRSAAEIAGDIFRGRPVRLEVEIAEDLPILDLDATRIRQVLLNLLSNAQRFTSEGVVQVTARVIDGEVVVSVSDTGTGIPADKLPHLFDEFYQVDRSLQRRHGGAGLGLAISKRFVEAHDGRIWAESEEGVGSTFSFALPIPGEHVSVSRLREGRPLESSPEARPPILVVDPDPTVADLVARYIEEYHVIPVEQAGSLAEEIALYHPQAVVCNVPPGGTSGCGAIFSGSVPFFECSLPSRAWVADDLAVAACLTKPITAEELLREIERLEAVHDVLVVDDDRGFCQLVERILDSARRDFVVRRAYSGESGLQALKAQRPDLLLLDLIMPGIDGFQVLDEMRERHDLRGVPVVLLTATTLAEDALAQRPGQMLIYRPEGLRPVEALRCLRAVIGVLEPHYDERSVPEEALVASET